jgi:hypothetical protein
VGVQSPKRQDTPVHHKDAGKEATKGFFGKDNGGGILVKFIKVKDVWRAYFKLDHNRFAFEW